MSEQWSDARLVATLAALGTVAALLAALLARRQPGLEPDHRPPPFLLDYTPARP